jgi:ELWxxDGT repeat protein
LRIRRLSAPLLSLLLAAVVLVPASATAAAPEATLVKQISFATQTAVVGQVVELGGALFFTAERQNSVQFVYPTELYRSDGTLAGTTLVFDSVDPVSSLRVVGGQLAFQGSTIAGESHIYTSDGTTAGTVVAGARLAAAGLYAVATSDGSLYSTSSYAPPGLSGGTLLKRAPGSNDPVEALPGVEVYEMVALGDNVFVAGGITTGPYDERGGVWVTDGTPAGTTRLAKPAGAISSGAQSLTATDDAVFFIGVGPGISGNPPTDDGPYTLYRATEAGITHVTRPDGSRLDNTDAPRALGNKVTFHLREDGKNALWVTDGTPTGTKQLIGADPALPTTNRNFDDRSTGGYVYTVRGGREIWRTDGTPAGTSLFGAIPAELEPLELTDFTALGGKVWFSAFTARYRAELWQADGTPTGTKIAFDLDTRPIGANIGSAVRLGDDAYFQASDGSLSPQLWHSDGTSAGTGLVTNFPNVGDRYGGTYLRNLTAAGDALYVINDANMASALWKVTPGGTTTLLLGNDPPRALQGPSIGGITAWKGGIAFVATRQTGAGNTIWTSDGTAAGTKPLPGDPAAAGGGALRALGDSLYYASPTEGGGEQLAKTDGTAGGASVLTTLTGTGSSMIIDIAVGLGGATWFVRREDQGMSSGLYRVDAAAATGATLLKQSSFIGESQATFGGRVYFDSYSDDPQQSGLWSSDGTAAGTRLEEAGARDAQVIGKSLTFIRSSGDWPNTQSSLWTTTSTLAAATRIDAGPGEVGRAFAADGHLLFARSTEALSWQLFGVAIDADGSTPDPATPDPKPTVLDKPTTPVVEPPKPNAPKPAPRVALGSIEFKAAVARDQTAPYKFSFTGELKAKPGSALAAAQCTGSVRITIVRGAKTVATKDAAVAPSPAGHCVFKLNVAVPRSKLARRGSLKAKIAFLGSSQLAKFGAPGHVKLKYG